jgi:hypothetical protein
VEGTVVTEPKSWHYGIVRHASGNLSLCEIYITEDGTIIDIVTNPLFAANVTGGESEKHIITALRNALRDAQRHPIINES